MARGYEEAEGDLAERLLTALEVAQPAGGDIRRPFEPCLSP